MIKTRAIYRQIRSRLDTARARYFYLIFLSSQSISIFRAIMQRVKDFFGFMKKMSNCERSSVGLGRTKLKYILTLYNYTFFFVLVDNFMG